MSEIEIILRIMIANAYYYGTTTVLEFNEEHINKVVPKLAKLFSEYGYKTEIFLKDENSSTYKKYKDLMLSIYGDTIYKDDKACAKKWFGLYDTELECLDTIHLSLADAEKWLSLANNYNQNFIETGSYILTNDIEVFESERERLYNNYKRLRCFKNNK